MQLKCNWQNDKSFYEKSESHQISHTEMLVTYNLQRCNVFLILYFPCCYSVTAAQIQIECLFDFKLLLLPLVQGFIISFKLGQRIRIISEVEDVKMYLAKTNLHKYYTIYYTPTLLYTEFSSASIYKIKPQRQDPRNICSRWTIISRLYENLIQTWSLRAIWCSLLDW